MAIILCGAHMKDPNDKKTGDLLMAPKARRQAAYVARQREAGRRQRGYWLTDEEAESVSAFISEIRAGGDGDEAH